MSKAKKTKDSMEWGELLQSPALADASLQSTLKMNLAQAILDGRIPEGTRLPSTRALASKLGVARITVGLAYDALHTQGLLAVRERSGHYVADGVLDRQEVAGTAAPDFSGSPVWSSHLTAFPVSRNGSHSAQPQQRARYPFLDGRVDKSIFPFAAWRESSRLAQSTQNSEHWTADLNDADDPFLLDQLCSRVLPKRGIFVKPEEVLITMGSQMGIYLLSEILVQPNTTVAFEEPGNIESRNIFIRQGARIVPLPVDEQGAIPPPEIPKLSCIYLTPGHQSPTGAVLPMSRRHALLQLAHETQSLIIEDDNESELTFQEEVLPAMKAMDRSGHVIYVGSLSGAVAPGLRIGYIVAHPALIERLRQLRHLILRHPPGNNQRALALFIAHGHYERFLKQRRNGLEARAKQITQSLHRHLPHWHFREPEGGSTLWAKAPEGTGMNDIRLRARAEGVLIESGDGFFHGSQPPSHFARLNYSSIDAELIEPGVQALAQLVSGKRLLHA